MRLFSSILFFVYAPQAFHLFLPAHARPTPARHVRINARAIATSMSAVHKWVVSVIATPQPAAMCAIMVIIPPAIVLAMR